MPVRSFSWFRLIFVTVLAIISLSVLINRKVSLDMRNRGDAHAKARAANNLRQLGLALSEFEMEYGSYPDRSTIERIIDANGVALDMQGDSSNHYFRQLIAAGICKTEDLFVVDIPPYKRPDGIFTQGAALEKGEVSVGYLMNGNSAVPSNKPLCPIAVAPLLEGYVDVRFAPEVFKGKALLLLVDGSVKWVRIRPSDNKVEMGGEKTLLETGEGTVWGTTIQPVIKAPLK